MTMKLIILCAIGFLFGCNCLCPSPEETKTIDLKLLEGKWWMIASTPVNKNNVTGECITFDVSFHPDTKEFKINFTEFNSIRKMAVYWEVIGKQLEQNRLEGSWQLLNSPRKIRNVQHQIIETNYNETVIMILCVPDHDQLIPKTEFGILLSRGKNLDHITFTNFQRKIEPFIDNPALKIKNTCV